MAGNRWRTGRGECGEICGNETALSIPLVPAAHPPMQGSRRDLTMQLVVNKGRPYHRGFTDVINQLLGVALVGYGIFLHSGLNAVLAKPVASICLPLFGTGHAWSAAVIIPSKLNPFMHLASNPWISFGPKILSLGQFIGLLDSAIYV